jgi:hypothetical protein
MVARLAVRDGAKLARGHVKREEVGAAQPSTTAGQPGADRVVLFGLLPFRPLCTELERPGWEGANQGASQGAKKGRGPTAFLVFSEVAVAYPHGQQSSPLRA